MEIWSEEGHDWKERHSVDEAFANILEEYNQ